MWLDHLSTSMQAFTDFYRASHIFMMIYHTMYVCIGDKISSRRAAVY